MPGQKKQFDGIWPRLSTRQLIVMSLLLGAGVAAEVVFVGHLLLYEFHSPGNMIVITAAFTGVISGSLAFTLMARVRERHLRLLQWLTVIREMNHHIRNALEAINYSASSIGNEEALATIRGGVARIEWALSEILTLRGAIAEPGPPVLKPFTTATRRPPAGETQNRSERRAMS